MEQDYISINQESLPEDSSKLKKIIKILQDIIKKIQADLDTTLQKLDRAEKKKVKLQSYNDDLQKANEGLGKRLHHQRSPPLMCDAQVQVAIAISAVGNGADIEPSHSTEDNQTIKTDSADMPVWNPENTESGSIADCLKAAAEEALQDSGIVFDANSGMYYDYSTGYYFDPDRSLYYEPLSGTYYYYNGTTGQYEFHSQVDVSQYSQDTDSRPIAGLHRDRPRLQQDRPGQQQDNQDTPSRKRKPDKTNKRDDKRQKKKSKKQKKDKDKDQGDEDGKRKQKKKKKDRKKDKKKSKKEKHKRKSKSDDKGSDIKDVLDSKEDEEKRDIETTEKCVNNSKSLENLNDSNIINDSNMDLVEGSNKIALEGMGATTEQNITDVNIKEDVIVIEDSVKSAYPTEKSVSEKVEKINGESDEGEIMESERENMQGESEEGEIVSGESEMEEGELSSSESEDSEHSYSGHSDEEESDSHGSAEILEEANQEVAAVHWPPCIRAMVTESDSLDLGTLFLVTCVGTTLGRDEKLGHGILIPDLQVSKMHAELRYDEEQRKYTVRDHASQNGTFVNDKRVSEPKVMSQPWPLSNNDVLRVGGTKLTLHIHPGKDTCDDCEPGLVQAKIQAMMPKESVSSSREEKERERRQMLNRIKKKYGLKEAGYTDHGAAIPRAGYEDKAALRRKTKGSDNPHQKDDMPASVHRAIPVENKGHKLLAKMGWQEGSGLGKLQQGRSEPIQVQIRSKQTAGLGSGASISHSLDAQPQHVAQSQRWLHAQERFMALTGVQEDEETAEAAVATPAADHIAACSQAPKRMTFIQGQTLVQNQDTTYTELSQQPSQDNSNQPNNT